jgi:ABC-type multidrug transport system permease subunit
MRTLSFSSREPEAVFWTFVFPILLTAGLGVAFRNRPPEIVKIGVTDAALKTALSREKSFDIQVLDRAAGDEALRMGRVQLVVVAGQPLTYRYDDTNPDSRIARLLADRALQESAGGKPVVATREHFVREAGSRYVDFLVPGLLGMNLMGSGIWGIGFAIVDARRKKLLKRLIASPMPRWQYLLSFLLSRLVMLVAEVAALLGFAAWIFGVPLRAPLWDLALICLLGALAFSALGLLIASRAKTIEAASGLMNFTMLPMWVFSGVFFSADRFPDVMQPFIRALPLTAVIDALRASMLQGLPVTQLSLQLAIMMAWMVLSFFTALKLFRWR